ncbi:MAG: alanine--tRNA ligase [Gammaproteobacteria bacterium]|nr:alanine--tRNA ligase [Gammaproteobacteria bacterium]
MSSAAIRQAFLDYFKQNKHEPVPSSSLIPDNDPTLLFVNAGMVQFKETFLGLETRPYHRAVSVQRCVRAGGKHNDLDQVGYTARHHTLFEMLGNFSFGDYFKREAIQYAWEFLTKILKLPEDKLWVTIYEKDDEAASIWLDEMGVSSERFSRCGDEDNFWSMGDTGPCGPCTEIFYDHGPSVAGGPPGTPEAEGDRYVEVWNLVFMQYNRDAAGTLHPLDKPSIDTGMGLERIAAIMQGVHSNYDTDIFKTLKKAIQALSDSGKEIPLDHTSLNVIADHIRATAFLIIDGVLPSNEGRGYVLRRIIRRAVRHGHRLKLPMPFLAHLVDALVELMGEAYPALKTQAELIKTTLKQEEQQFAKTLEHGLSLLKEAVDTLSDKTLPGDVAFKLYDTYGFPLDLTEDILREQGLSVDSAGFDTCMKKQRLMSQSAQAFRVDYTAMQPFTETSLFEGYTKNTVESTVLALRIEGEPVDVLTTGARASVVLDKTPFYAESGGQVGDSGEIKALSGNMVFRVDGTQRVGGAIVHEGELLSGDLKLNDVVSAEINIEARDNARLNHTATHLLHATLKHLLGDRIEQKGSLVDVTRARFDFAFDRALTKAELIQVEDRVNIEVRSNYPVETKVMSMEDAVKDGAVALFGEKYGDEVRVLTMGDFSKELCGGTHARQTGDIGLFKITAEYGVARGVRRLEFVTGQYALQWMREQLECLDKVALQLKTSPLESSEKLTQLLDETKQQARALTEMKQRLTADSSRALLDEFQQVGEVNVLLKRFDGVNPKELRNMLDALKSRMEPAVIVLIGVMDTKMHVVVSVSKELLATGVPKAGTFVQALCGRGGGRDDMAQGGGALPDDLTSRMDEVLKLLA